GLSAGGTNTNHSQCPEFGFRPRSSNSVYAEDAWVESAPRSKKITAKGSSDENLRAAAFDEDFSPFDDDDIFSRNMGTPAASGAEIADFDQGADDNDMLEVAETLENHRSLVTEDYSVR